MKYIKNSFQRKLIVFLLFAITIPILISIVVTYQYTKNTIKDTYISSNSTLLYHSSQNFKHYLTQLNQASLMIYHDMRDDKSFHQIITKRDISFVSDQDLFVNMQYITNAITDFSQAYLYLNRSNTSHRFAYNIKRYSPGQSYPINVPVGQDHDIEATHLSHTYNINKFPYEEHEPVITFHKNILNLPSDEILGTISFDIKLTTINEMTNLLYNKEEEQLFLLDQYGQSIYSSHDTTNLQLSDWLQHIKQLNNDNAYYVYEDSHFHGIHLFQTIETPIAQWTIIKRIPFDYLYTDARQLTFINSLIVSLFLVIAIIAVLYISYHFTSPLKRMLRYINQIEIGKVETKLDINRTDEIGILSRRFHQLIQNLNHAINNEYKLVLANRTNQLKALQAQVNPHFMNNALQSIGTLALQNNQKNIYSLISSLGKMMRYQINTSELPVKLSSELDYVKHYLQLQSQRFENQLQYYFDIGDNTEKLEVPRMLLQPIVENCFKHGFIKHNNNGEIWIKTRCELNKLTISISDNGIGISNERLLELRSQLAAYNMNKLSTDEHIDSIGLFNTQARLQLYYNKRASLHLLHNEPNGLLVEITILLEGGASKNEIINR